MIQLEHLEFKLAQAMRAEKVHPAIVFAFEKTGLFVTEQNGHAFTRDELHHWRSAVAEYHIRKLASNATIE